MLKRTQKGKSTNKQRGEVERMEFRRRKILFSEKQFFEENQIENEKR